MNHIGLMRIPWQIQNEAGFRPKFIAHAGRVPQDRTASPAACLYCCDCAYARVRALGGYG